MGTNPPYRLFIATLTLLAVIVAAVLGWQLWLVFASSDNAAPLPTTAPTVVAVFTVTTEPEPSATASPTRSLPTVTDVAPTPNSSPTLGPSPTPSNSPTVTPLPTDTPLPTLTPTSLPRSVPTLSVTGVGRLRDGVPTPATAIPTPVPTFEVPSGTTNVLLIGSDTPLDAGESRSDTIIVVSISESGRTASMISLPRDLYVYIPNKTMNRLNVAANQGGVDLLKQTILYNFGVPIHYYARVDFEGFKTVVDAIDGIDINVSCRFEDWRLRSPDLDPQIEDNWEQFALEPGVHHMDGDTALWYARSRLSSNDFDRGRRQQQLLRAMLNHGVDLGLVPQVPALWGAYRESVETDIDVGRLLQFAALAPSIRENGVQHLYLAGKTASWEVPTSGANVQLPVWEGDNKMEETFRRLFLPPALNRATRPPIFVEVINMTDNPDLSVLAADNLAWYGFVPVIGSLESLPEPPDSATTHVRYYAQNFKGSFDWLISWIFSIRRSQIELITDVTDYPHNYQVILGRDYDPCLETMYSPQAFLDQ